MAKPSERCRSLVLSMAVTLALQLPLFVVLMYVLQSTVMTRLNSIPSMLGLPAEANFSTPIAAPPLLLPSSNGMTLPQTDQAEQKQEEKALIHQEQPKFLMPHGVGHYFFVQMTAYRDSLTTFYVVGITSVLLRRVSRPVYSCEWHPNNSTHDLSEPFNDESKFNSTEAQMLYIDFDENGELYVPAIVNCTFVQAVGADGSGGILAISVYVGGRYLKETRVIAKTEKRGEVERVSGKLAPPFKYAFCSPPIHNVARPYWFLHWLTYHHYIFEGKAHFFFYNVGGLTDEARQMMAPFLDSGLLTIVEAEDQKHYLSWYFNQLLFINDCLHRTKYLAEWVAFHDFDEFIDVQPPRTLHSLLEEHKEKPWLTYGSIPASAGHCRLPVNEDEWPLERVLCRNTVPECMDKDVDPWNCIASRGRRKYIARTSKVITTGVHKVALPSEGGVNLNTSIARVYHYRGALSKNVNPCGIPVNLTLPEPQLRSSVVGYDHCYRDDSFSQQVQAARKFAAHILQPSSNAR